MRRLIVLAFACTGAVGALIVVNKRREKRNEDRLLNSLAQELAACAARQVTTLDGRIALARAALKLQGSGILMETILALMPASGRFTESCNIDALMRFMGQPVLLAREIGYEKLSDLTDAEQKFLCGVIAADSRFLANCVLVAPTLINLPTPLNIPGDTLVALDRLLITTRSPYTVSDNT